MTQTAIIGLGVWLVLYAVDAFGFRLGIVLPVAALVEAILIFAGSRLSK